VYNNRRCWQALSDVLHIPARRLLVLGERDRQGFAVTATTDRNDQMMERAKAPPLASQARGQPQSAGIIDPQKAGIR
jgi:hypothetical protein